MGKKVLIGDIIEIPTKRGLAYAQFSHCHEKPPPRMGAIIRALPGFFTSRPHEFQTLSNQKELFYTLFPVQAAVNRKIFSVVGHAPLPTHAKSFPLFRGGNRNSQSGKVDQWWLWDGLKSWKIDKLTDEQLDLPIKAGWNDRLLISRLEQGWTPRHAEAFLQAARLRNQIQKHPRVSGVRHFLLFETESMAHKAKQLIEPLKFTCEVIDNGSGITLVVHQGLPLAEEYVEATAIRLTEIAMQSGGRYDAWEVAVVAH